jgi:hypothetical protein
LDYPAIDSFLTSKSDVRPVVQPLRCGPPASDRAGRFLIQNENGEGNQTEMVVRYGVCLDLDIFVCPHDASISLHFLTWKIGMLPTEESASSFTLHQGHEDY